MISSLGNKLKSLVCILYESPGFTFFQYSLMVWCILLQASTYSSRKLFVARSFPDDWLSHIWQPPFGPQQFIHPWLTKGWRQQAIALSLFILLFRIPPHRHAPGKGIYSHAFLEVTQNFLNFIYPSSLSCALLAWLKCFRKWCFSLLSWRGKQKTRKYCLYLRNP